MDYILLPIKWVYDIKFIYLSHNHIFMKKHIYIFIALALVTFSCSKAGDSTTTTPVTPPVVVTEATIAYGIDIDPGAGNIYAALGATQTINVNLSSAIPKAGVQIDVSTKKDSDGTPVSASSTSTTTATNTIAIENLQPGVLCTTTITITSKSTSTNSVVKSFKIARK